MGVLRTLLTGRPDPLISAALQTTSAETTFAVDAESFPSSVVGLESYVSPTSPVARVSRREAIQVPAVKRSRDLIAGSLGQLPLNVVKSDLTVEASSWLQQPEKNVPRSVTMTRLVEDLLYEQIAWWRIVETDYRGFPARGGINLKGSDPHHRVSAPAVAAPQRAQPCGKFAKIERLAEIIVRTKVEPFDPILGHVARGQEQDRRRAARAAPFAQKIESGAVGKADIEHDGVMREARNRFARVGAISDRVDRMAFERKAVGETFAQHVVVLDHQNAHVVVSRSGTLGQT